MTARVHRIQKTTTDRSCIHCGQHPCRGFGPPKEKKHKSAELEEKKEKKTDKKEK